MKRSVARGPLVHRASISSSSIFNSRPCRVVLCAVFTRTSMRPKRSTVRSTASSIWAGSDTSPGTTSASDPSVRISSATASSLEAVRPINDTAAPSAAKANATPRPDPCPAPVTRATRPCMRPSIAAEPYRDVTRYGAAMAEVAAQEATARPSPPDAQTLDARQRARRDRIVQATLELMLERDYDSLQMKDITAASGAALGTVYRYFSSKEHLVAEGLLAWSGGFEGTTEMPPARSIDRLKLAYRRAARAFERYPCLFDHLLALQASDDPYAARVFDEF